MFVWCCRGCREPYEAVLELVCAFGCWLRRHPLGLSGIALEDIILLKKNAIILIYITPVNRIGSMMINTE